MEVVEGLNSRYVRMHVRGEAGEGMEGYRSRIVKKNKITSLLRIDQRYIDGAEYLYFDITGLQNLKQVVMGEMVTVEKMNVFIDSLEEVLQRLEEYLLLQTDLCLQPECVLYDGKCDKWKFMYVPNYNRKQTADIEALVEAIMDRVDCENEDDLERFYDFYSEVLKNAEDLMPATLVRLWDKGGFNPKTVKKSEVDEISLFSENVETMRDSRVSCEVKPMYKGRIYEVPYHGVKVNGGKEGTLT